MGSDSARRHHHFPYKKVKTDHFGFTNTLFIFGRKIGGGGGLKAIFLEDQVWAFGTTGETFGEVLGPRRPTVSEVRAMPRPKIGLEIVIFPRWS